MIGGWAGEGKQPIPAASRAVFLPHYRGMKGDPVRPAPSCTTPGRQRKNAQWSGLESPLSNNKKVPVA
jgi:hypothetical protein